MTELVKFMEWGFDINRPLIVFLAFCFLAALGLVAIGAAILVTCKAMDSAWPFAVFVAAIVCYLWGMYKKDNTND